MRALVVIGLVACGGGYRTRPPAHAARPGCSVDGTLVDVGAVTDAAPVVIAYVHHSFQPPQLVAVWADGSMVASHGRELVQGTVPAGEAARVAREVAAGLSRAPDYAELPGPIDQPRVELIARDGAAWRHALMWGARPTSYDGAPDGFRAAYRALLSLQPAQTSPFRPDELTIAYAPVDTGVPPVAWPADVPAPPADRTTATIDARFDAQLRALVAASVEQRPPRPIAFGDKTWRIEITRRFRGQQLVETVRDCARAAAD